MKRKRKIIYDRNEPYIWANHRRYYLKDFLTQSGYHYLSFTNCGYFAGFRITGFEYGIDDYAIIEKTE